jgi:Cell Wall Hydrolase
VRHIFFAFPSFLASFFLASPTLAQTTNAPEVATQIKTTENADRALQCLSLAIAYEAGFESREGQQAVAEVILNRTRHPAYPKSVCGVVFQGSARKTGCQFTFTCDGAMKRGLPDKVLLSSRSIAQSVLTANFTPHVGGATHYHANYVSPYWAPSLIRVGKIGAHIFYRAPGSADQPAHYTGGVEPIINGLGNWAIAPDALTQRTKTKPVQPAPAATEIPAFAPWGLAPIR